MNKGKRKAFYYQFTNIILTMAFIIIIVGLVKDCMDVSSWENMSFLAYYAITMIIVVLSLLFNQVNLQNVFYRDMDAFTARTAYECILHPTKGYYTVYLHCLICLGEFKLVKERLESWHPSAVQLTHKHYFEGMLAYYDHDDKGLHTAIEALQAECEPQLEGGDLMKRSPMGKRNQKSAATAFNKCRADFLNQLLTKEVLLKQDYGSAIEVAKQAVETASNAVEKLATRYDLGLAYQGAGNVQEANTCFDEVKAGNQHLYFVRQAKKQ